MAAEEWVLPADSVPANSFFAPPRYGHTTPIAATPEGAQGSEPHTPAVGSCSKAQRQDHKAQKAPRTKRNERRRGRKREAPNRQREPKGGKSEGVSAGAKAKRKRNRARRRKRKQAQDKERTQPAPPEQNTERTDTACETGGHSVPSGRGGRRKGYGHRSSSPPLDAKPSPEERAFELAWRVANPLPPLRATYAVRFAPAVFGGAYVVVLVVVECCPRNESYRASFFLSLVWLHLAVRFRMRAARSYTT